LALIFALPYRLSHYLHFDLSANPFFIIAAVVTEINIILAVFNLIPVPPLDGSKVLFALLPKTESNMRLALFMERYGLIFVFAFIFFGFSLIVPIINILFAAITGTPFVS